MLDGHGTLAVAELVVYTPTLLFCLWNTLQYGFRREAGWVYLFLFCILKLAGAAMIVDIQLSENLSMLSTATILNTIALSPLLNTTLSFLNPGHPGPYPSSKSRGKRVNTDCLSRLLKPVHIVIIVALVLSITGSMDMTKTDQGSLQTGASLLKIACILFIGVWVVLTTAALVFRSNRSQLEPMQRILLGAVMLALPFLLVRIIYSGLNAINLNTNPGSNSTNEFSPVTGSLVVNICMGFAMEIAVVVLYAASGVWIRISAKRASVPGEYPLPEVPDPELGRDRHFSR